MKQKSNELITLKDQLENASSADSELHQRIQEFEKSNKTSLVKTIDIKEEPIDIKDFNLMDENLNQNTIHVQNIDDQEKQKSEKIKLCEDKLKRQNSVHDSNKLQCRFCKSRLGRSFILKKHMETHKMYTPVNDINNDKMILHMNLSLRYMVSLVPFVIWYYVVAKV